MLRDEVLALLKGQQGAPLSGEAMSQKLGVSRAAVWKAMETLRQEGYVISSAPRRGYVLECAPDKLSPGELMKPDRQVGRTLVCLERVDSTNNEVKRRAAGTIPAGLVVVAEEQTGGRGRRGRTFVSPPGGLYLSALLQPACSLEQVSALTAWSAVAVCDAIQSLCGVRPRIKWPNDIILEGRKLCGIVTELDLEGETAALRYVVVGIGVNLTQTREDFGPEVAPVAISLAQALGSAPRRAEVASALLDALEGLNRDFPGNWGQWLERYRKDCLTIGSQIKVIRGSDSRTGTALGVDDTFALIVRWEDGSQETVSSGEVSVRGLLGYV